MPEAGILVDVLTVDSDSRRFDGTEPTTPTAARVVIPRMQNEPMEVMYMRKGPNTPEGIAIVTRNLPHPSQSGPRTAQGKYLSSLNSLSHGLAAKGFLKCRKDKCAFHAICPLQSTDEGRELYREVHYGAPCPIELAQYEECIEQLEHEGIGDDAWRHLWAMLEVRIMRRRRMTAMDQVLAGATCFERTDRYSPMLWREKQMLLTMVELC